MASVTAMLILAHQGGWDEIAFVLGPLVVLAGMLVTARRRAGQIEEGDAGPAEAPEDRGTADPT